MSSQEGYAALVMNKLSPQKARTVSADHQELHTQTQQFVTQPHPLQTMQYHGQNILRDDQRQAEKASKSRSRVTNQVLTLQATPIPSSTSAKSGSQKKALTNQMARPRSFIPHSTKSNKPSNTLVVQVAPNTMVTSGGNKVNRNVANSFRSRSSTLSSKASKRYENTSNTDFEEAELEQHVA